MRHDEARANTEEEFALMQDDRSRLAVELDAAARPFARARIRQRRGGKRLARAAQRSSAFSADRAARRTLKRRPPLGEGRAMSQVSVTIDGRKYRLACNEGEEARLE